MAGKLTQSRRSGKGRFNSFWNGERTPEEATSAER
jgi:hypothetical protein